MDGSADGKEVSGGEIASPKCQSVTFVPGTSSSSSTDEHDKPKLQRIPTPFYEHLAQSGVRPENSAGCKDPEQTSLDPEEERDEEKDEVKGIQQAQNANCNPPKSSSGRRIHREFSMSRDDDDE